MPSPLPTAIRVTALLTTARARLAFASFVLWLLASPLAFAAGPKAIGTMTLAEQPGLEGIGVVGVQWTARNTSTAGGGGGGVGKVTFDAFKVVKFLDATSPPLLALMYAGTSVTEVRIDLNLRRGSVASYVLYDALIIANDRHAAESGVPLLQELSFSATAIRETLTTPGGTVTSCYSLKNIGPCD